MLTVSSKVDRNHNMINIFSSVGFICCGLDYINSSTSLCCVGVDGYPTIHPAGNTTVTLQCCGSRVIRQEEECCNGIGYDPRKHVCADRPTPGLQMQVHLQMRCVCVCLYVYICMHWLCID